MYKLLINVLKEKNIDRYLIILLIIGGLYSISVFLSNTFVNVYLWRQTNDYLPIAIYNLAIFFFQPITYLFAGVIAKKYSRIIVLRLGVIFLALFFMAVLYLREDAASYSILLGSLLGIGYGFYWLAYHVLTFEITEPHTRDIFNGFLGSLESLAGMIGPIVAGAIIVRLPMEKGYIVIFTLSLILFIIAVVFSFFLQNRKTVGHFALTTVIRQIKYDANWFNTLLANLAQGIRDGVFGFVIAIWIFLTTNSELSLGMFHFVLNIFSFIFYLIVLKVVRLDKRKHAIFLGAFLLAFAVWLILFEISFTRILLYAVVIGIAYPILLVPFNSLSFDVIGKGFEAKNLRIEYIILLEIFTHIGKIAAVLFFLILYTSVQSFDPIPLILAICSSAYVFIYVFMRHVVLHE